MSPRDQSARRDALQDLARAAAGFEQTPVPVAEAPAAPRRERRTAEAPPDASSVKEATVEQEPQAPATEAGYVPVAVAPERGNTRPAVPVDGRLHMRVAQSTLDALDSLVAEWKADHPERRDLERATLVRIGLAMVLADTREHGDRGAVGEAVSAALDPAVRHTAGPMPALERWIRSPGRSE